MNDKVHVVMVADKAYEKGLEVAKASMVGSCSDPGRIEFHLFDDDSVLMDRIRKDFGTYKGSPMAFMRLYLGELLPDIDWVVYSDVDTLWRRDVLELAGLFDETKTIQWVRDLPRTVVEFKDWCRRHEVPVKSNIATTYSCSGICIINLKRWRERNVLERCKAFVERYGCPKYADQDILNAVIQDEAGLLPGWWDVLIPSLANTPRCVMHLTGVGRCFSRQYSGNVIQYLYWQHIARGTPFRRPFALPFYLHDWMIRLCLPISGVILRDRIRRYFAWRWFLRKIV